MIDTVQLGCFRLLQSMQLISQIDGAAEVDPDREMAKARIAMGLVGLFVLFVGMFLMFWLFSRYMRRIVADEPETFQNSRYSQFGYQYYEQLDREKKRKHMDD